MISVWFYDGSPMDKTWDRIVHHTINRTQKSNHTHVMVQVDTSVLTFGRHQTSFWAVAESVKDLAPPEQVVVLADSTDFSWEQLRIYEGLKFSWTRTLWNEVVRKCKLPKFLLVDNINCVELAVMVLRHMGYDIDAHNFDELEAQLEA